MKQTFFVNPHPVFATTLAVLACTMLVLSSGCVSFTAVFDPKPAGTPVKEAPKEGAMSALPHYWLEPSDVITVQGVNLVPKTPYALRTFDIIFLDVLGAFDEEPITGRYSIEPGGVVQLGTYGAVRIDGLTVKQAEQKIQNELKQPKGPLKNPVVTANLVKMTEPEPINNIVTIGPDGHITLGSYGRVYVAGLTLEECRDTIELHLSKTLEHPTIAVDVYAYNTKTYYVIYQGRASQELVVPFPYTGNETVLKAIANMNGLAPNHSKRIWVARPVPNSHKPEILPVDWIDVTAYGSTSTNYQLLPNDRVYVLEDRWVSADGVLARILTPLERIMGFSLLGATTATRFYGPVLQGGGERMNPYY